MRPKESSGFGMYSRYRELLERGSDPREAALGALRAVQDFARESGVPLTPDLPVVHLGPTNDGTVPWCRAEVDLRVTVIHLGVGRVRPFGPGLEFVQVGQPLPRYRQWCPECLAVYEQVRGKAFPVDDPLAAS